MKTKLGFGFILFFSCVAGFTTLFLILGTLGAMQDLAGTRDTRLLLSLGIVGAVISNYLIYDHTLNKVFLVLPIVGVVGCNILGFIYDCENQIFVFLIGFFISLTDLGTYYVRRLYNPSGVVFEGSASKWEAWRYYSGATTFWGVIWWKLKDIIVFVAVFGAVTGLIFWVQAG